MKILLTGATGYIGMRLLPVLIEAGHQIVACTRAKSRFQVLESWKSQVEVIEVDFLKDPLPNHIPKDIDIAYYLVHSMSASIGDFGEKEKISAENFKLYIDQTRAKQIIYLTGIISEGADLSPHLQSRLNVEKILSNCNASLTALRAGIIVGSGSASFEIIRDIVEKLPIMITPKWLNTKCQPIGIRNVIEYLTKIILHKDCMGQTFDISSGEILTYKEMLLGYAKCRNLKRLIMTVPIMTPRLSSYWLFFVTSTSYPLAVNLVDSMKIDVVGKKNNLQEVLGIQNISYEEAVDMAFQKIQQNMVVSSWKDSLVSSLDGRTLEENMEVPKYGCFRDNRKREIAKTDIERVQKNIWSIGGDTGWYYGNTLWRIRGYMDKLSGGVGLRRGRTHQHEISAGDALDFWRVLVADEKKQRLLLYAEMILPGDAWLEFKIVHEDGKHIIKQTATFRPEGIMGRLYWYSVLPFHYFVFDGMLRNLVKYGAEKPMEAVLK